MALIVSAATGNFNAGATWVGGVVPTIGDEAQAATGHTITITANTTCDLISNAGSGIFTLNDGVTLTANVTNKTATLSRACMQFTGSAPASATIVGNVTSGPAASTLGINNVSTGTVNITGNVTGGSGNSSYGVYNSATGTFLITGNVVGGSATGASGLQGQGNGTITITGNVIAANGTGVTNIGSGTVTITGNSTGAAVAGVNNSSSGTITINGIATGGSAGVGVNNASTGVVNLSRAKGNTYGPGNTSGLVATAGASNAGLGVIEIQQLEYGTFGMSPTSGTGIRLKKLTSNVAVFNYCDTAGAKTLIDATQNAAMPAATDVRNGVSYASGALTGSAFIPAASSVASGVPVGSGTGTAILTAAAIRAELAVELARIDAAVSSAGNAPTVAQIRSEMDSNSTKLANLDATVSSRLAPSGTLATVTTLTNAPTVPTASAIATQVRSELSVELGRVDAAVSTRLASSAYSAAPTTAQIATAVEGSLLNEADGSAVLNAIVGAIGNTNLSEVSLVAAVRADLERVGGKIDSIPAAPTAAANATAVWASASKTITGGTVDTLTNSPSVPSAASIASATRTELAVELARVDVATSTRLAGSAYTAPANSDITAIKAKSDLLNTDRLANVATTAIVGNLIAQANS
jgi:hypothetical protein